MSMIFPGMDPYLENPLLWRGVHTTLIVYLRDQIQPQLAPRYLATVEDRVYVEGPDRSVYPDVWITHASRHSNGGTSTAVLDADVPVMVEEIAEEVEESYIGILDLQSGQKLVTLIEVVSPTNKVSGPGRDSYLQKQQETLASSVHLVEIDLLRAGEHVLAISSSRIRGQRTYDYLVSVNRAEGTRKQFELYFRMVRERLPRIRIPLSNGDPDVSLDLQAAMERVYEAGRYRDRIDYSLPCVPYLSVENQEWANGLILQAKPA